MFERYSVQPAISRTQDTERVRSINPQAMVHLERIRQLVAELAQAEAKSAEASALVQRIEEELTILMDRPNDD